MPTTLVFVGECDYCGRTVGNTFPYQSQFLEQPELRLWCRECDHPTLARKQT